MNTLPTLFNKHKKVVVAALATLVIVSGATGIAHRENSYHPKSSLAAATPDIDSSLNFPHVTVYSSTTGEVKGKVIYIPQIHRMPGSDVTDSSNDPGFVVQKEIYGYVSTLADEHGVKFFMTESGLYGELPKNFTTPVQKAIEEQNEFTKQYQNFVESLDPAYQEYIPELNEDVDKTLSLVDRSIYLRGANIKLEAERGEQILTYGSQNPETYAQTVQLVRERLAIQKKLRGQNTLVETVDIGDLLKSLLRQRNGNSSTSELIKKYLSQRNSPDLSRSFAPIKAEAQRNNDQSTLEQIESLESLAESMDQFIKQPISSVQVTSGSSEPLRLPADRNALKARALENEQKFNEIVLTKRSNEAVDYFIKGLNETNSQTGVLVYGAGHGEQIVEGLTSQGYEVTVISPELVHKKYPQF